MNPSDFSSSRQNRAASSYIESADSFDVNALGTWYEDLEEYEDNIEKMAATHLDQSFQDELQHVNQWFGLLSDAEKTATLYALLQHSSQVQIKFFIHMLQEMRKPTSLGRGSERASTLMNLSNRRLSSISQQQNRNMSSRHSFALGDTQELDRIFGSTNRNWLGLDETPHPPPQPRTTASAPRASSQLRPRSVAEFNNTPSPFSNSWISSRQSTAHNNAGVTENFHSIERPRSADITSWNLPSSNAPTTWQPLSNIHDTGIQPHWKNSLSNLQHPQPTTNSILLPRFDEPRSTPNASSTSISFGDYNQLLGPSKPTVTITVDSEGNPGYGSDPGDSSCTKYRSKSPSTTNATSHLYGPSHPKSKFSYADYSTKEDIVDMKLLEDVTAWFRSMRLHKYNNIFDKMRWQDIVKLNDQELQDKGVAALGARRKMLKVFENVQEYCKNHQIDF